MKYFSAFYILVSLFILKCTFAQHPGSRLYTVTDGLVQSEVTTIHQDDKGFLWVGTKNGISRFDGNSFQTIRDSSGISESWINQIRNINDSAVLILTQKGCLLFTYRAKSTTMIGYPYEGDYVAIWIKDGIGFFITKTATSYTHYQVDQSGLKQIESPILSKIKDLFLENGWIDLNYSPLDGNFYFRNRENKLACLRGNNIITLKVNSFKSIYTGQDERIYFVTPGLALDQSRLNTTIQKWTNLNGMKESARLYCIADTTINLVVDFGMNQEILDNQFSITNKDTFLLTSYNLPLLRQFLNGRLSEYKLPFPAGTSILQDREQNVWLGSPMGLLRIHPLGFTSFNETDGLHKNTQVVIEDRHHNLIVGGYEKGVQKIENCKITTVPKPTTFGSQLNWYVYPGAGKDREGNVFISVNPYCLMTWDGAMLHQIKGLPVSASFSFCEDTGSGIRYCGSDYGLLKLQPSVPGYNLINVTPGNKRNKVVSMLMDNQGRLLLGGFKGLSFLEGDKVTHLPDKEFGYNQGANTMVKDHRGNIWIGNSEGLWIFDMKRFRKIPNPWFNDLVVSLCTIDSTKLFIGGLHGIGFLDLAGFYARDTAIIRYFNSDNGFTGNECQQNAVCYDSHGFLWVATTDNLQRIDPRMLPPVLPGPVVYIERVCLVDDAMKLVPLVNSSVSDGQLELRHDEHNIRFDFTAPVFRGSGFVRFRYRLEGQDKEWSQPTSERYAAYTNLAPGRYTFQVMACNDTGEWSVKPACFHIFIIPAFWQTWWFWSLLVILLAAFFFWLGYLVMNRRKISMQEKLESGKKIAELQLIAIRNQIDPHFTFNAMNSIASVILKEEKEKAYTFFVKLSNMIRQVLTSGDKITRTLAEELVFVQNYLEIEKLRFRDSFQFRIDIIQPVNLDQEVPKMVIQTYAENALKHGLLNKKDGDGELVITIGEADNKLHIEIEDNGIGREKAREIGQKSTGKGMMILNFYYDFFDRYNDQKIIHAVTDLITENNEPAGTNVTIIIPAGFHYNMTGHE
ncbi:MAG: histidine kinase [Bacteroidales bacterium]